MNAPTPYQLAIVRALLAFADAGRSPTFRELARALGTSPGTTHRRVFYARKKGLVGWGALSVTEAGRAAVAPSPHGA